MSVGFLQSQRSPLVYDSAATIVDRFLRTKTCTSCLKSKTGRLSNPATVRHWNTTVTAYHDICRLQKNSVVLSVRSLDPSATMAYNGAE